MEGLSDVTQGITTSITSVFNVVGDIFEFLLTIPSTIVDGIVSAISSVFGVVTSIFDFIITIPELIISGISDILKSLFIPSENYFNDKINVFIDKFEFIQSIKEGADTFRTVIESNEVGSIEIDMSKINSRFDYGNKTIALSLDWYTPYKPVGDKIISAFLWLGFLMNVFKDLPSIINGVGSTTVVSAELKGGKE